MVPSDYRSIAGDGETVGLFHIAPGFLDLIDPF